ncbi:hypothetical protein BASA62_003372 [Batrachochytrium salamandrivorans]|nr:hypothetical protein BASA62_003372 [Batrachochytrium salamandrivorans]
MPKAHGWAVQKVRERGLHREDMVTVDSKLPWPTFQVARMTRTSLTPIITAGNANIKEYPRALQSHFKVLHLESKLKIDLHRQFSGLTENQRDTLIRIIDKNARIRQRAGLLSGVFEAIQDDMYDYAFNNPESEPQAPQSDHDANSSNAENKEEGVQERYLEEYDTQSSQQDSYTIPDVVIHSSENIHSSDSVDGPHRNRKHREDVNPTLDTPVEWSNVNEFQGVMHNTLRQSIAALSDDLADLEFPIEEYDVQSKLNTEIKGEKSDNEDNTSLLKVKVKSNTLETSSMSLRQKYSQLIDIPKRGTVAGQRVITKQDLEQEAMTEMKMVSVDLQKWVADVIDSSVNLDPKILSEANSMTETGPAGEQPKPNSQSQRLTALAKEFSALERVDTSGFDVLLNACKPTILEAKPPVRLNVIHEMNPPNALAEKLKNNCAASLKKKKTPDHAKTKKVLPEIDSSFSYTRKPAQQRPRYGVWYVSPHLWKEHVYDHGKVSSRGEPKDTQQQQFGGIVQAKLDEINRKREIDYAQFMKEMGHGGSTNAVAGMSNSSTPGYVGDPEPSTGTLGAAVFNSIHESRNGGETAKNVGTARLLSTGLKGQKAIVASVARGSGMNQSRTQPETSHSSTKTHKTCRP